MSAAGIAQRRLDFGRAENALLCRQRPGLHTGESRAAAGLGREDVRHVGGNHFVARPTVHEERNLVAHGAGGQEHRGFLGQKSCNALLQGIGGGVFGLLLVANLGLRHRLAHAGRWARRGVARQIN